MLYSCLLHLYINIIMLTSILTLKIKTLIKTLIINIYIIYNEHK